MSDSVFLRSIKRIRATMGLPTGENPISTAARAILDRFNVNVPLMRGMFVATASATVGNTGTETTLLGAGRGSLIIPEKFLVPGAIIRVRASGTYGTKASTVGNLTLKLKAGTTALATATVASLTSSMSARRFIIDAELVCRTEGASGVIQASGSFRYAIAAHTLQEEVFAETNTTSFSTLARKTLDLTATWATSDVANTMTCSLASFIAIPAE